MYVLTLCPHVICVLCHVICSRMVAVKQLKDACTVFLWISNPHDCEPDKFQFFINCPIPGILRE